MKLLLATGLLIGMADVAWGHFLFVVPTGDGSKAQVFLSETLDVDDNVDSEIASHAQLKLSDGHGREAAVDLKQNELTCEIPLVSKEIGPGQARLIFGSCEAGVMQRGAAPPFLLVYFPKTILGDPFDPKTELNDRAPVEIVPHTSEQGVVFELKAEGKPAANSELTVILPDGSQEKATTGGDGKTPAFAQPGRYGVWARSFVDEHGVRDEKPYEQVRRYATLVVDIPDEK